MPCATVLRARAWERPNAHGSMFVWAKLPGGRTDSMAFCEELMEKAGVVVTPARALALRARGTCAWRWSCRPIRSLWLSRPFARRACIRNLFRLVNSSKPISCSYFTNSANNFGKRSIFGCE